MRPLRGIAYYRVSDPKQTSIPDQRRWANRAAPQEGVELVREFQDHGTAGDVLGAREGLQDVLAFCLRQAELGTPIQVIVLWDGDRLSRADSFATAAFLAPLMQAGVTKILTYEGMKDLADDATRALWNIQQDFSRRAYAKSLSANVTRKCIERARLGQWPGGIPPYAYCVGPDGHLALSDPQKAETVRRLADAVLTRPGLGSRRLSAELQAEGVPPPRRRWTPGAVLSILTNANYTGDLHYGRESHGKYNVVRDGSVARSDLSRTKSGRCVKVVENAEPIITPNAHPAILDKATFAALQVRLAANRPGRGASRHSPDYSFSGLVRCGCGALMYGCRITKTVRGKEYEWRKYVCSAYLKSGCAKCTHCGVHESELIDRIAGVIETSFAEGEALARLTASLETQRRRREQAVVKDTRRLRRRIAELGRLTEEGAARLVTVPQDMVERVAAQIRAWEAERGDLASRLEVAEQQARERDREDDDVAQALAQLRDLGAVLRAADPARLQKVVHGLVKEIRLKFERRRLPGGKTRSVCLWHEGVVELRADLGVCGMAGYGDPE
jgi:DNA invertase Pin-like site-specific DNA recombinase